MNKSLVTNLLAAVLLAVGVIVENHIVRTIGLFALSGAITNWLAVHMLFDKVPGLYGSGVIPQHFAELKAAIRNLMMTQFFHQENISRFLSDAGNAGNVDLAPVVEGMDISPTFDGLLKTIEESSFGGMLAMIGGSQGLEALREPFVARMKTTLVELSGSEQVQQAISSGVSSGGNADAIAQKIETIVDQRLEELTPEMVKTMIQDIISQHLGWLVVWGGVFGGLIGLLAALFIE